jgi:hypothetical protein
MSHNSFQCVADSKAKIIDNLAERDTYTQTLKNYGYDPEIEMDCTKTPEETKNHGTPVLWLGVNGIQGWFLSSFASHANYSTSFPFRQNGPLRNLRKAEPGAGKGLFLLYSRR